MIDNFKKNVNLDSYSESKGYVGHVDLTAHGLTDASSLAKIADLLVSRFGDGCFISSLYVDANLKNNIADFGLTPDFYENLIEPLLAGGIIAPADYENWSEDDAELLNFTIFGCSSHPMVSTDNVYKLLRLYFQCDHYLLFGHAFFVQEKFSCYLSDEGIGCVSFGGHGSDQAVGVLDSLLKLQLKGS